MMNNQRGSGKFGCVVTLGLLGLFIFGSIKVIPVYLDKLQFEEDFARLVSQAGAQAMSVNGLHKNIERIADLYDFKIVEDSLKHSRKQFATGPPQLHIEVTVFREVEFPGYTYRFQYRLKESTFIGTL
ncbi:MAG TPA: hypothetical protein VLV83_10055 [Acidobacteriota bacterium]|nr:hypothetical protein [Acidobacteriota bacterium]